jgi:hypothetical protein
MEQAMKLTTDVLKQIEAHIQQNMRDWFIQVAASRPASPSTSESADTASPATERPVAPAPVAPATAPGDPQLLSRVSRLEDGLARTREQLVRVEDGLENLGHKVTEGFAAVERRFEAQEKRLDQQDERIDRYFRRSTSFMAAGFSLMTLIIAYETFLR